jgi:hypothetical protein
MEGIKEMNQRSWLFKFGIPVLPIALFLLQAVFPLPVADFYVSMLV